MMPDENETVYAEDLPEDYADKVYSSTMNQRETPAASKPVEPVKSKPIKPKPVSLSRTSFKGGQKGYDEAGRPDSFKGGQKGYDEAGRPAIFKGGQKGYDEAGAKYKKGGSVGSASKRADGIAQRGKTRGKVC
jgi:hypothetical protein